LEAEVKKVLSLFLLITFVLNFSFAQEAEKKPEYGWKKQVVGDLNFTQNEFDNWSAGGENSLSWQFMLSAKFENDQEKYNWSNSGKFQFGKTKVGDLESRKSADEINLESVYTYKLAVIVNPYAAVKALTQFTNGFAYPDGAPKIKTSEGFDPLYITESIGVGIQAHKNVKTRLGAAAKQTISKKEFGFADDPETVKIEDSRNEIGAESVTEASISMSEKIVFDSKLELFSNFDALNEIDVNWDNTFSAKVSDLIKVSFNFRLFYDRDISVQRQWKQTLAVGLSYSLL
jgi:hypothetical protein